MSRTVILVIILFAAALAIVGAAFVWLIQEADKPILAENTNIYLVEFAELDERIKIEAKVWGLLGNSERIELCSVLRNANSKPGECLKLYASDIFYKKEGADRLVLYLDASGVPLDRTNRLGSVNVIIGEIKSYDKLEDYRLHYKNYGLSKATTSALGQ